MTESNGGIQATFRKFTAALFTEGLYRKNIDGLWGWMIRIIAIAMSLFQIWSVVWGALDPFAQGSIHFTFILVLTFAYCSFSKKSHKSKPTPVEIIFILLALAAGIYFLLNIERISFRKTLFDPLSAADLFFGAVYVVLGLEAARRTIGIPICLVVTAFLIYAFFGHHLPGVWGHRPFTFSEVTDQLSFSLVGIWGSPLIVASTFVFVFLLFGAFLQSSGAGTFFFDVSSALTGGARGGASKVAVLASGLFGTISGSPTANVVTTGSFTIPMSKRLGYRPEFAAAVEAVASTGGSIMPPVMGSAAFLMAEITNIPYGKIITAAALPALLYYISIFMMVHFEAIRIDLPIQNKEDVPQLGGVMARGWQYLLPLGLMVWLLISGKSPSITGVYSTLAVVAVSWFRKDTRMGVKAVLCALEDGAKIAIPVTTACAAAGMVIAGIMGTGLGGKMTSIILGATHGYLFVAMLFTMLICLVLGMGMPVAAAYVLTAMLAAPTLISMGVGKLAAHLFVVYFSIISAITPPVAVAAFAAAGIAESNPNQVGFLAVRLGLAAFIVPFMFVYQPGLLLQGDVFHVIQAAITSSIGVIALAGSVIGWFAAKTSFLERILLGGAGLLLIHTGTLTDVIGFGVIAAIAFKQKIQIRKSKSSAHQ
ncbi:MAG: TRAP transporter fused permease subunit [Thermodesulfobacteriota bacterium]